MPNLTAAVESAVGLAVAALGCVVIGVGLAVSRDALVRDALAATRRQAVAIRLGLVLAGATPLVLVLLPVGTPAPPPPRHGARVGHGVSHAGGVERRPVLSLRRSPPGSTHGRSRRIARGLRAPFRPGGVRGCLWQNTVMNLLETLRAFNAKERYFLAGEILGNTAFTLGTAFRNRLSARLGLPIPADAYSAMDYHLDWLYAALKTAACGRADTVHDNAEKHIQGQQEDIDWLVAFANQDVHHLVLIEAKGVTSWGNKQMISKANRLRAIFGDTGTQWGGVVPHFVLMSPAPPSKLLPESYPQWMAPQGRVAWLELAIPALMRVYRCDEQGRESKQGRSWKAERR